MPYQTDKNWGRCTNAACSILQGPRCDGFMCFGCCMKLHKDWEGHRHPNNGLPDERLPVHYGGPSVKPEYDYSAPPREGVVTELGTDYERVFVPLSNYRANKDWPADYVA